MTDAPGDGDTRRPLPSRRAVLLGAAVSTIVVASSGCARGGGASEAAPASSTSSTPVDQDVTLLTRAIADEEALLNFCTSAARRYPRERALLSAVTVRQKEHVARLRSSLIRLTPPVSHQSPRVPPYAADVVEALGQVVATAHSDRAADCLAAGSGLLAELFGSVAASHAATVHVVVPAAPENRVVIPGAVARAEPLQPCLSAEHAAVYGYGLLAGVLSAGVTDTPMVRAAVASYTVHRDRRDTLVGLISAAGGQPAASEAVYDTPFPVTGVASARRLAGYLEDRCSGVYAQAVAATTGDSRELVSTTLVDCAVRAVGWGIAPTAFPGLGSA